MWCLKWFASQAPRQKIPYCTEKRKAEREGGGARVSSYLLGFGLLIFRKGKMGCFLEAPWTALPCSRGLRGAGGAVPLAAAGWGSGCGAQPWLRGSRPRSLTPARKEALRRRDAQPEPGRAPTGTAALQSRAPPSLPPTCPRCSGAGFLPCRAPCLLWT